VPECSTRTTSQTGLQRQPKTRIPFADFFPFLRLRLRHPHPHGGLILWEGGIGQPFWVDVGVGWDLDLDLDLDLGLGLGLGIWIWVGGGIERERKI